MSDRETNIRSVFFLVIGILLLLSLVVCIFIVSGEKDLIETQARVSEVVKDADGTGKNQITVVYKVKDGNSYEYTYTDDEDLNENQKVTIYYDSKNVTTVTTFKVPKIIFIAPAVGLVLCVLGLYELFKKNNPTEDGEEQFKTSVIGVIGNTQQLKIVADESEAQQYEKSPEEKVEPVVKTIKKVVTIQSPPPQVEQKAVVEEEKDLPKEVQSEPTPEPVVEKKEIPVVPKPQPMPKPAPTMVEAEPAKVAETIKKAPVEEKVVVPKPVPVPVPEASKPAQPDMTDAILKKVQNTMTSADSKKVTIDEDDIKQAIKDVLKEVIAEVKEEKTPPKKVEQRRVLPNYYYISGTSLIYEEAGKEAKEISLKTVKKVVRTVNSEGNVVKLIVSNEEIKCILTNMKNIDLEQVASLLNNKMRTIDENFKEEIEYKEY